ncbi:MAG: hypothetical protein JW703_04810 [Candidatus Diapherotrites archaeon]|nr:hypothetical protein [Candidatus Diapherotrites archaeon]
MRKVMFFRFGGKDARTPRLVGAFILTAAVLMFFASVASMFDNWDAVKGVNDCLSSFEASDYTSEYSVQLNDCRTTLFNKTGLYLKPGQLKPTLRQSIQVLLEPIAMVFFWLAVLFLGWLMYKSGDLVLPVEMIVREPKEHEYKKK